MIGQVQFVLGAFAHELQTFGPALDDLVQAKLDGLSALVRAVEDSTVRERALVVAVHLVRGLGLFARTFLDHLIHKAAAGGFHSRVLGNLCQELLALGLGGRAGYLCFFGRLILQLLIESLQSLPGLLQANRRLRARKHRLQSGQKVVYIIHVNALLIKTGRHAHSKCVRFFIHRKYNCFRKTCKDTKKRAI